MPSCSVLFCNSGGRNKTKTHSFNIGSNPERIKWLPIIGRQDLTNCKNAYVCELHFKEEEIIFRRNTLLGETPYERPKLVPGAVPSRNLPSKLAVLAKSRKLKNVNDHSIKRIVISDSEAPVGKDAPSTNVIDLTLETSVDNVRFSDLLQSKDVITPAFWNRFNFRSNSLFRICFMKSEVTSIDGKERSIAVQELLIKPDLHFCINVMGRNVDPARLGFQNNVITSVDILESLLSLIVSHNVCRGCEADDEISSSVSNKDIANTLRHRKCRLLLPLKNRCDYCESVKRNLQLKRKCIQEIGSNFKRLLIENPDMSREDQIKSQLMSQNMEATTKGNLELAVEGMKLELNKICEKMEGKSMNNIDEQLQKLGIEDSQQEIVHQILSSYKNNNKIQNQYSDSWLLLPLIIHMNSPTNYQLLQTNILPLPCVRIIRRYLAEVELKFGFDEQFFKLLKHLFSGKTTWQKHGVIILDEMGLRESVLVKNQTLACEEVIHFGNDNLMEDCELEKNLFERSKEAKEKLDKTNLQIGVDTGLVFMFQPLYDTYAQPIAVFASRGPAPGAALTQLLLQVIIQLEKAGALVHGIISDGATANRKFWNIFGVRGVLNNMKNSFIHPMDDTRQLFVWSDTPHLMKTIRNCFENKRVLQMEPQGPLVKWEHIEQLYNEDSSQCGIRRCPKLTANHIKLNSSSKMRVRHATQIFSKSVSAGLQIYKKYVPCLSDSDGTSYFCKWVNDIFDALNNNIISEGISQDSPQFEVLLNGLQKLDEWETYVAKGQISEDSFLTFQMVEGFRVTLNSTLELIKYLKIKYDIDEVYVGRINQNSFEVRINNAMFKHLNKFIHFINIDFSHF